MDIGRIKTAIRDIPDFPKPGIIFKDITPILKDAELFRMATDHFERRVRDNGVGKIAAIDARGFFFAAAVAERVGIGLVPIRKKGKLPYKTYEETCELEYGLATLSIHQDAFEQGERVVLIDDLLATGGTALASAKLIKRAGGELAEIDFLIELAFLKGRQKLSSYKVSAPIVF